MSFDADFRSDAEYFGREPERLLREHLDALDPSRAVLDVGMGQGRNALWLAQRGFAVDGIEPSSAAREAVNELANKEGLTLRTFSSTFQDFEAKEAEYGSVLVLGLIPILSRPELGVLRERIDRWLCREGVLFVTAFTTEDPSFPRITRSWSREGRNSFRDAEGNRRTFLAPGEILSLFSGYEILHHTEYMGEQHRHGSGPLHRHAWTESVLRHIGGV